MAVVFAGSADADLLRCKRSDGKWIYTDDKSLCPDSKPFEPKGAIQSGGSGSPASTDAREGPSADRLQRAKARRMAAEAQEAESKRWRDRKAALQKAVDDILDRRTYLEKFISQCNRGGLVYQRDKSGIKKKVRCNRIEDEYASLAGELEQAELDLARLPEDCRRAGCLPGWIR